MSKIKLLAFCDSSSTCTGFGIVAKNILSYLYDTGRYHIDQLAINYPARFRPLNEIPWNQMSTKALDPDEPYGKRLFLRTVAEGDYDVVWVMNDTYVVYDIAKTLKDILARKRAAGKKVPRIVYYYPVDCHVHKKAAGFIEVADVPVCYNDYGREETLKTLPEVEGKLEEIPHGVDTDVFFPLAGHQKNLKQKFLGGASDKFMILNVNRNSHRKQLARTIYTFSQFKKQVPDSVLLMHTQPVDGTNSGSVIDLRVVVEELGLSFEEDVLFPAHYEPSRAYPEELMNQLYNAADCYLTTHVGEGWGVSIHEALATGTPVIAPDNTGMPQMLGENSERGYMYPCKDYIYPDNSGLRPIGYTDDIVLELFKVFRAGPKENNPKTQLARQWAEQHNWKHITPLWDELFNRVITMTPEPMENVLQVERI